MQIFTDRIKEMITNRSIIQLKDMLDHEQKEREKQNEEDMIIAEHERLEKMQRELDQEVGLND